MIPLLAAVLAVTEPFVGATVEQVYDSNVMNSRGQDAVTRVTPRVGVLIDSRRWTLGADYRLGLHLYAGGTADSTVNHRGALAATLRATRRLNLGVSGIVLAGDDPVLLDRPGVAIPQGGFFDLTAMAHADYRATRRLGLGASYTYRRSRFELAGGMEPLAFDGDEHRVDAAATYLLSRRWTGRILGRAQRFVSDDGADSAGGGLGAEWKITERTRARAFGGPIWFSGGGGGLGWFGGADVIRVGQRWRAALRAIHDIYGGTSAAEAVWADSIYGDVSLRLSRDWDVRARAGAYRGGVAPNYDMNVSGLLAHAEVGYTLARRARFELYGEHRAQDAGGGISFGDVQRTVAGVRVTAVLGADLTSIGELP